MTLEYIFFQIFVFQSAPNSLAVGQKCSYSNTNLTFRCNFRKSYPGNHSSKKNFDILEIESNVLYLVYNIPLGV